MSLDTFICGLCKVHFSELELFIKHKTKCIPPTMPTPLMIAEEPFVTALSTTEETVIQTDDTSVNTPARSRGRPRKGEKKIVPEDDVPKEPEKLTIPIRVRGRGRPRKGEEKNVLQRDVVPDKTQILSQARNSSRPRKGQEKNVPSDAVPEELIIPVQARSRGRPRKGGEKTVPEESTIPAQVRSCGRPRKGEEKSASLGEEDDENPEEVVGVDESRMNSTGDRSENHIQDIPVFNSEEEKLAFEQSLSIDLSAVDHMFRVSVIEQNLNENATSTPRSGPSAYLSLYACNTCHKVFKTLSHMRLHCLTHTNFKPFKCSECAYATSSKGSLYTHMRKHTGQYYMCSQCPFKSVNKSHLVEHVLIHSNVRHRCGICKKDYSSIKSLINHVRSYHSSTKIGQKYLEQFLAGRNVRGDTKVFHQCHVCNRKFKRKIDCDRHLFVHNIKDIPCTQRCELCNYAASRRKYLEKHFLKHQVIYCCCLCREKFVSSVRLLEHFTNNHLEITAERTSNVLLEESIGLSFYLLSNNNNHITVPSETRNDSSKDSEYTEPIETSETNSTTTGTHADAVIRDGASMSVVDPVEVDMSIQSKNIGTIGAELQAANENGEIYLDTTENDGIENVSVNVELGDHPLTAMDSNDLATIEIDTTPGNILDDQEIQTDKSNNDSPSPISNEFQNNCSQIDESENGEGLLIEDDDAAKSTKVSDLIKRLRYQPLSLEIFKKLRQTFGAEECEFCGRFFNKRSDLDHHVRSHTGDMPFQCDMCDFQAMTRITLKRHVERDHDKKTLKLPCKKCDFVAHDRQQFWNHQRKHQDIAGLECPECHKKFGVLKKLRSHILQEHPTMSKKDVQRVAGPGPRKQKKEDLPFRCEICDYRAMTRITLKRHVRREHPKTTMTSKCKECDFVAKNQQQFLSHQRKHQAVTVNLKNPSPVEQDQDKITLICKECEFVANSRAQLRNHELQHRGIISGLECPECNEKFKNLRKLRSHILTEHPMGCKEGGARITGGPSTSKKKKIGDTEMDAANETEETERGEEGGGGESTKTITHMDVLQECSAITENTLAERSIC